MNVFRSAVKGSDGEVDAGYLALFWIMTVVITVIPFMCVFAAVAMWLDILHKFDVQALGIGIGSVCTGFGVAVGAVGAFRAGDKPRADMVTSSATVTAPAAPAPAPIASVDLDSAGPDAKAAPKPKGKK